MQEAQKFLQRDIDSIGMEEMPASWSWEDVNGYDFTSEPSDQGSCGSCYLLATNGMLEARNRIWFGVDRPLSV